MTREYFASITKITDLKKDISNSLEFVRWRDHISNDSTVFIKPNFTYPYFKEGITTNPEVIRTLLELLKDKVARVIVGESNGGNHSFTADQAFKGHGMHEICKETGAELINLSTIPGEEVKGIIQGKTVSVQTPQTSSSRRRLFLLATGIKSSRNDDGNTEYEKSLGMLPRYHALPAPQASEQETAPDHEVCEPAISADRRNLRSGWSWPDVWNSGKNQSDPFSK